MLEHKKIRSLDDYFVDLNGRQSREVYFYRINGYTEKIGDFIKKYYDTARRAGVVIEGKIPNPDEKNLAYYSEIMGMDFQMNPSFISNGLKKWLPRMNDLQRQNVADSIYDSLDTMRQNGKTENMLKNAYIKFMCWLYYKFERIVNQLGENELPKILYEGDISNYELMLISILSNAGSDVVLLQYHGDAGYLKSDPASVLSDDLQMEGMTAFPEGYCLKKVREAIQNDFENCLKVYDKWYGKREDAYMANETGVSRAKEPYHFDVYAKDDGGYAGVALKYIRSKLSGKDSEMILCVPNNGAIPGLLNTDIVEVTCDLKDGEMIPHKVPNPGELQMELIRRVKIYERLASEAIRTRSISKAIDCLMVHPLVNSYSLAKKLVETYLATNKDYMEEWN